MHHTGRCLLCSAIPALNILALSTLPSSSLLPGGIPLLDHTSALLAGGYCLLVPCLPTGRIDEMGSRIDELEKSLGDLMAQVCLVVCVCLLSSVWQAFVIAVHMSWHWLRRDGVM